MKSNADLAIGLLIIAWFVLYATVLANPKAPGLIIHLFAGGKL